MLSKALDKALPYFIRYGHQVSFQKQLGVVPLCEFHELLVLIVIHTHPLIDYPCSQLLGNNYP